MKRTFLPASGACSIEKALENEHPDTDTFLTRYPSGEGQALLASQRQPMV